MNIAFIIVVISFLFFVGLVVYMIIDASRLDKEVEAEEERRTFTLDDSYSQLTEKVAKEGMIMLVHVGCKKCGTQACAEARDDYDNLDFSYWRFLNYASDLFEKRGWVKFNHHWLCPKCVNSIEQSMVAEKVG